MREKHSETSVSASLGRLYQSPKVSMAFPNPPISSLVSGNYLHLKLLLLMNDVFTFMSNYDGAVLIYYFVPDEPLQPSSFSPHLKADMVHLAIPNTASLWRISAVVFPGRYVILFFSFLVSIFSLWRNLSSCGVALFWLVV